MQSALAQLLGRAGALRDRPRHVRELLGAVQLGPEVAAGNPVVQLARHLQHPAPGPDDVDGQPDLDTPPGGQRQGGVERLPGQAALAGQRLGGRPAGQPTDPLGRRAHDDPEAAPLALLRRQHRDRHVGGTHDDGGDDGPQVGGRGLEVGVDEEDGGARGELGSPTGARGHRCGLAPVALVPDDVDSSGPLRDGRGLVGRPVVDDDDPPDGRQPVQRGDRGADPGLLVLGRDDRDDLTRARTSPGRVVVDDRVEPVAGGAPPTLGRVEPVIGEVEPVVGRAVGRLPACCHRASSVLNGRRRRIPRS